MDGAKPPTEPYARQYPMSGLAPREYLPAHPLGNSTMVIVFWIVVLWILAALLKALCGDKREGFPQVYIALSAIILFIFFLFNRRN